MSKARDIADLNVTILDSVEASATADQTNAEIRAAVEAATDSNVFTDADHTKLNGINQGVATTDSPTFVNVTATSLDISGNIDVDGITNLDVVDIDGAVDMASTLVVATSTTTPFISLGSTGNSYQTVTGSADGNNVTYRSYQNHIFKNVTGAGSSTDGTERMRLSSGNLLVGTSTITPYDDSSGTGMAYRDDVGILSVKGSNIQPLILNRVASDGTIVDCRKNGVSVGSIGVIDGNNTFLQGSAEHGGIAFSTNNVVPFREGTYRDNNIDLGQGDVRWKDLYLSGVMAAGNGSASAPSVRGTDTNTGLFFPSGGVTCFTQNGVERGRWDASGALRINGSTGYYGEKFTITSSTSYTQTSVRTGTGYEGHIVFRNANGAVGTIFTNGSATNYNTSSDQRLKENIADADDAGSKIDAIQVRKYDWKVDGSHQDYGMIAQELQAVAPEAVSGDADSEEMMGVDYSKLVPMMLKEIQSLRNRVAQLEE